MNRQRIEQLLKAAYISACQEEDVEYLDLTVLPGKPSMLFQVRQKGQEQAEVWTCPLG